jgi:hypothetical protein
MADEHTGAPPAPVAFLTPIITGILIGVVFLLVFIPALHKPAGHSVPVGVVAPQGVARTLESSGHLPGLKLRTVSDVAQAEKQIKDGDIFAAYVVQGTGQELLVSSAHGAVATHTIEGMFTGVAASTGAQLRVKDVAPVSGNDPNGISLFYLIFGATLGAFLFGQGSFAVARHLPVRTKMLQATIFSVVLGLVASLVARVWLQVLPGSFLAESGILILLAASVALFSVALTSVAKDAGVALGTMIALILGTGACGGAIPVEFIPPGFAFFDFLPSGEAMSALRDVAYYDSGNAFVPVMVLLAWIVASVAVIVLMAVSNHGGQPPNPPSEALVTATTGIPAG